MNDENVKIIICDCGQPNHLVFVNGVWIFDEKKHGKYVYPPNDETAKSCINCHKPFSLVEKKVTEKPVTENAGMSKPEKSWKKTKKTNLGV